MYELELIEDMLELEVDSASVCSVDEALRFRDSLRRVEGVSGARLVEIGNALRNFGEMEAALECYDEAIKVGPSYLPALLARGELYFQFALCATRNEERLVYGRSAVSDFRRGMVLSLGSSDVVWSLVVAHLVVGEAAAALGLADRIIGANEGSATGRMRDFVYLLGFARLFVDDPAGAIETFCDLEQSEGGESDALFGKVVVYLVCGNIQDAVAGLARLGQVDRGLYQVGVHLMESGCGGFGDVARALFGMGFTMRAGGEE